MFSLNSNNSNNYLPAAADHHHRHHRHNHQLIDRSKTIIGSSSSGGGGKAGDGGYSTEGTAAEGDELFIYDDNYRPDSSSTLLSSLDSVDGGRGGRAAAAAAGFKSPVTPDNNSRWHHQHHHPPHHHGKLHFQITTPNNNNHHHRHNNNNNNQKSRGKNKATAQQQQQWPAAASVTSSRFNNNNNNNNSSSINPSIMLKIKAMAAVINSPLFKTLQKDSDRRCLSEPPNPSEVQRLLKAEEQERKNRIRAAYYNNNSNKNYSDNYSNNYYNNYNVNMSDTGGAPTFHFRGQYRKRPQMQRRMTSLNEAKRNSRFQERGEAVGFLKNRIRRIMHLLRWFAELKKSEVLREHVKRITDFLTEHEKQAKEQEKLRDTYFDRTQFASRREVVISPENAMILTLKGASRTSDQVKQVVNNLSWAISSFAEYPIGMQYGLAGVAMYQRTNPQRVIIRQGHYPENFYFIISGWAQVIICKQKGNTGEYELNTVAKIGKGQCFGEIALIHQTTRQATVESVTEMELLVITKYDFFKIFLAKPDTLEEPEYIKLLRTLTFLHDWPIEKVDETPGACILHFFRPGTVVVSDSNSSNWIYIVKSGSCVVMKKLKHVVPKRNRNVAGNVDTSSAESMFGSRKIYPRINNGRAKPEEKPVVTQLLTDNFLPDDEHEMYLRRLEKELREKDPIIYREYEDNKATDDARKPMGELQKPTESKLAKKQKLYEALYAAPKTIAGADKGKKSVFVQMGLLRERDVFGLEDIQFDDDIPTSHTSVCLVSRGSELIMFSKDLFLKHVTAQGKETLRKIVKPYPDESILQHNLQVELDWRLYRSIILEEEVGSRRGPAAGTGLGQGIIRASDVKSLRKWQ